MGPDTYDVASLLRDRGAAGVLGSETEMALVDRYAAARGAGCHLRQRYFETLLQRSIKILGTFARQALIRDRRHYLDFIPPALESVRLCIGELPEFADLESDFPLRIR
jgi:aminoglycoside/choline kinase family phosphotransferase